MIDPLSFTASLIAVSQLTAEISKSVKPTLQASDEVLALGDELEDLEALTKQWEVLCQEQWPDKHQASVDEAKRILDEIVKKHLQNIQELLAKCNRTSIFKAKANTLWAWSRKKINVERQGIRRGKDQLLNIFHLLNSSCTRPLSFQTTKISLDVENLERTQDQSSQNIVSRLEHYLGPRSSVQTSTSEITKIKEVVQRLETRLAQEGGNTQKQLDAELAPNTPEPTSKALTPSKPDRQQAYQMISCVLEGRESKCALWCTCACHSSWKQLSLPSSLEQLTGQLLVGFSIHSMLRSRCNVQSCKRSSQTRVRLRYRFPAWFSLAYSINFRAQTEMPGTSLRFPHVRPSYADVFEMAVHGRLDDIKSAFTTRKASIYDIEATDGHT